MAKEFHYFIAIEGIDGAGKSTIRNFLFESIKQWGYPCFMMGQHSWLNPSIARIIIDVREQRINHPIDIINSAYFEDKLLHAKYTIQPGLRIANAIADRYIFSDATYHEVLYKLNADDILNNYYNASIYLPDLIIFVDLEGAEAFKRVLSRSKDKRFYEREDILTQVSQVYRRILLNNPQPWLPRVLHFVNKDQEWQENAVANILPIVKSRLEQRHKDLA